MIHGRFQSYTPLLVLYYLISVSNHWYPQTSMIQPEQDECETEIVFKQGQKTPLKYISMDKCGNLPYHCFRGNSHYQIVHFKQYHTLCRRCICSCFSPSGLCRAIRPLRKAATLSMEIKQGWLVDLLPIFTGTQWDNP